MKTFETAKVGDKVYSLIHGEAEITYITNSIDYPIRIKSANGGNSFTLDGKLYSNRGEQLLFWSKPEIIAPPAPKRLVTKPVSRWINVYQDGTAFDTFATKEVAIQNKSNSRCYLNTIELTGTYQVEE